MKRNLLSRLLIATAAVLTLSACAKVNYEGRPLGVLGTPLAKQRGIQAGENKFVMTEGEVREFQVEFTEALAADTNFVFTLMSKSKDVDVAKRFKSITGNASGKSGQKFATVQIAAVDVDNIRQGTQEFLIALTPDNSAVSISADLTLLDAQKLPVVSFVNYIVVTDVRNEARLELQLSEASTVPVVVEVYLKNGSALYHTHYSGFKTPSPNSEVKQTVVFAPNTTKAMLPVIGIRNTDICDLHFFGKINKFELKDVTVVNDTAKILIPCRIPIPPPPPIEPPQPPPPAPVISLTEKNKFVMSEGESVVLNLEFVEAFRENVRFNWAIEPTDRKVVVAERFKTLGGSATALAGTNTLALDVSAVDIDNLKQGDQDFKIVLSIASQVIEINLAADLLLIDKNKSPTASFAKDRIDLPASGGDGKATIVLNETSTLPIILDIETKDGTALDGKDYVGFKQTFVIKPGDLMIDIPVKLLPKDACLNETNFFINVTRHDNATMTKKEAVVLIPSTKDLCPPPPPPPPPAVTPKPAFIPAK
ncbi:hypothetical protein K2P97_09940 [bacterium]|nr:hypothetical protein [bacterium]